MPTKLIDQEINFITARSMFTLESYIYLEHSADIDMLTSTLKITIPNRSISYKAPKTSKNPDTYRNKFLVTSDRLTIQQKEDDVELIARETVVEAAVGFYDENKDFYNPAFKLFRGVIKEFQVQDNQIVIYCEDPMAYFKDRRFLWSFKAGTLFDIIKKVFERVEYEFGEPQDYFDTTLVSDVDTALELTNTDGSFNIIRVAKMNDLGTGVKYGDFKINDDVIGRYFIDNIDLPSFSIDGYLTIGELFQALRDQYGLYCYFRERLFKDKEGSELILHCGLRYFKANRDYAPVVFGYPFTFRSKDGTQDDKSGANPIINKENLQYNKFDKTKELAVVINSNLNKTSRRLLVIDISVPEATEEQVKANIVPENNLDFFTDSKDLNDPDVKLISKEQMDGYVTDKTLIIEFNIDNLSLASMKQLAGMKYLAVPDTGITGSFTTFKSSDIWISDIIDLKYESLENYSRYYVDKVLTTIDSTNGLMQTITINTKLKIE